MTTSRSPSTMRDTSLRWSTGLPAGASCEAFTKSLKPERRVTAKPLQLVIGKGPEHWEPIAGSREWEEILELLARHPAAGLSGEGQMTDDLLEDLCRRAPTLTALGLSGCRQVTDEGMRHLASLPSLQHLDLSGTGITDAGLQVLRHLPQLRTLSLWNRVTEAGIAVLAHCHELEHLNLWAPPDVGDAAVRALAGKRKLHHLTIALTDAGLPLLHELPVFKSWHGGEAELATRRAQVRAEPPLASRHDSPMPACSICAACDGLFGLNIDDSQLAITAAGLEPLISLAASCRARRGREGRLDAVHRPDAAAAGSRSAGHRGGRRGVRGAQPIAIDRVHLGPSLSQSPHARIHGAGGHAGLARALGELPERGR